MSNDSETPPPGGQFLVYQAEDGKLKLEAPFEGETVWLTQQHMGELFQTTKQNIGQNLKSVFSQGELVQDSVVKEILYYCLRQELRDPFLQSRCHHFGGVPLKSTVAPPSGRGLRADQIRFEKIAQAQ